MNKSIKELEELKLVGFRVLCPGDQYIVEIPKATMRLNERIGEIKQLINPSHRYGAFVVENETEDKDGYWVCAQVKEFENIPSDMVSLTIPPQRYAVIRHTGKNHKIMHTYEELHTWIEDNSYTRLKDKWHVEKYDSWDDVENVEVELYDTIR